MRRSGVYEARRRAFTLVELLVVMAIISVLASLLLPVLSRVKETAYETKCLNNQRQIHFVFWQYADSNNDCIPLGHYWIKTLDDAGLVDPPIPLPQENPGIWVCPSQFQWMLDGYPWGWSACWRSGYTINYYVKPDLRNPQPPSRGNPNSIGHWGLRRIATIRQPSRYFHTVECGNAGGTTRARCRKGETLHGAQAGMPHADGRSVLGFFDGHVAAQVLQPKVGWHNYIEPWEHP